MSYLGRHQLGYHLPLSIVTANGSGTPTAPDAVPTITVFDDTGTELISGKTIPAVNKSRYVGQFHYRLFLGSNPHVPLAKAFATGKYYVRHDWVIGGVAGMRLLVFDIVAGGNVSGQVIGMEWFERPHGGYLVMQLDSGQIVAGKNPKA